MAIGADGVAPGNHAHPIRILLQCFLVLVVVGLLAVACSDLTGPGKSCPDSDYPLFCKENKGCCPNGFPVSCGGKCYQTDSAARASCSARLDTCYRE